MATATMKAPQPEAIVQDAIRKISTLATLPEVTNRIIAVVEDPKSTAGSLHKIMSHDPALVTRILKVVNSSFYGLPGQIGSVERAIVLLGLNAVKNIAVAASLGQLFRGAKLCTEFTARDLWTHCIAVGVATRDLARQLKIPLADEAFLAGMIHDIGIVVELQIWPEQTRLICQSVQDDHGDFCQAERRILGVDHQMLGKALAEQWKFPRTCQQVAGYHHNPNDLGEDGRQLVSLVHIADTLCCQAGHGFNLTALRQTLDAATLSANGVDSAMLERVRENLNKNLSNAMDVLK